MFRKFRKKYNEKIIKKFRTVLPSDIDFYKDVPTFGEFVDYLIATPSEEYNEHWRPYYQICNPCHVNFSIIVKLESLKEDLEVLVKETGFTQFRIKLSHETKNEMLDRTLDTRYRNKIETYFAQIDLEKILKLHDIFRIDFDMFNYSIDEIISVSKYNATTIIY